MNSKNTRQTCSWSSSLEAKTERHEQAAKTAMQNFDCLLVERDDSAICRIGNFNALLGALEAFRPTLPTNSQNSALLFLQRVFLRQAVWLFILA